MRVISQKVYLHYLWIFLDFNFKNKLEKIIRSLINIYIGKYISCVYNNHDNNRPCTLQGRYQEKIKEFSER